MPLPVILGALAALATGAGLGKLQRMETEKAQEKTFMRETLLKSLMSGADVPEALLTSNFDKTLAPSLRMLGEASRVNQQRQLDAAQGFLGGEAEGFPATPRPTNGSGIPGARLTQPPAPTEMAPGDTSIEPPAMPQASVAPATPVAVGGPAPNVAPIAPPMRPKPSVSMDVGGMKISTPGMSREAAANANRSEFTFQQQRDFDNELSTASRNGLTYPELKSRLEQRGLLTSSPQAQAALDAYGKSSLEAAQREAYVQTVGNERRPLTPAETQAVNVLAWLRSGYGPMPAETQDTVDQRYIQAMNNGMTNHPDSPFAVLDSVVRGVTGVPSEKAVEQVAAIAKANMERKQALVNPGAHPAATQAAVNEGVGFRGVTEAERARAGTPAPLTPEATAGFTSANQAPPTMAQLGQPGRMSVAEAQRAGEATKAAAAGQQAAATAAGSKAGAERARPDATLTPQERSGFVDPQTLTIAPEGSKWRDVGPGGKYVSFTGTKEDLHGAVRLREVVGDYYKQLRTLKPLLEKGAWNNVASRWFVTGTDSISIPGTKISIGVPSGALPDATAIRAAFPDVPAAQAEKYARAMVRIQANQDTMLSILRTFFNEKGNARGDLIASGAKTFPSLGDNWLTASEKFDRMLEFADAWERGYGLPGFNIKGKK